MGFASHLGRPVPGPERPSGAGRAAAVPRPATGEAGQNGWPPGAALRLARLRERALRERAKAKRAAAGAARGRLPALVSLLRAEQARRPDCGLLQRLAAGVEAALADAAPWSWARSCGAGCGRS